MAGPEPVEEPLVPSADGVHPASMVDRVYDQLLLAIVSAELGPGTPMSQNKLADHLGVSRTPVREALLRLESEGLVQRTADMGFIVASITPEEVNEACDLLKVLDTYVYVRAARVMSDEQLADLLELALQLVHHADADDTQAWKEADTEYHRAVMEAADNRFARDYLEQTRRRVQRFWLQRPNFDGRLHVCSQDHVALAQAMVDGDEAVLADTVHSHIERLRAGVLARLESAWPLLPTSVPWRG